jgi:hypothetical protein
VSSDDIEAAGACDLPRLRVGDRGSGLTSLTIVIEGRIAVTMVALSKHQSQQPTQPNLILQNLRRTPTQTEQHPRKQQLRIHIPRLYEYPERKTYNTISHDRNTPHAHSVAQQTPRRTRNKRYQLIHKPQRTDRIADITRLANALCDDKRYRAIEEDEEAYAEERDAEQVRCDLRARGGELETEHGFGSLGDLGSR